MQELCLHVMDIAENGVAVGASLIEIEISEDRRENRLSITVRDNGPGIPAEKVKRVLDPFYTTRTTRRVGLGLSMLAAAARNCGGSFELRSEEGRGTEVVAVFQRDHLDLAPFGDMASSLTALIFGNPEVNFVYRHAIDGEQFEVDTREIRRELEGLPLQDPAVLNYLKNSIREALAELGAGSYRASLGG